MYIKTEFVHNQYTHVYPLSIPIKVNFNFDIYNRYIITKIFNLQSMSADVCTYIYTSFYQFVYILTYI